MKGRLPFGLGLVLILVCSSFFGLGEEPIQGIGAGWIFREGVDARALGMGGAFVSVADNYSAPYWNPAGIGKIDNARIGGMHTDKFGAGIDLNYLSGVTSFQKLSLAGTYIGLTIPDLVAYDDDGNLIGIITYSEMLVMGSLAIPVQRIGYLGANVKGYYFSAPKAGVEGKDATAKGLGLDGGILLSLPDNIYIGVAAFDIGGTRIKWKNTRHEPTDIALARFALGASFTQDNLLLAADYYLNDRAPNVTRVGGEVKLGMTSLRAGSVKVENEELFFTVGAGLKVTQFNVDFAWVQNKRIQAQGASDTIVLSFEIVFSGR